MPSVPRPRIRTDRTCGAESATADQTVPDDPDDLIELVETIEQAFDRMAQQAADNAIRDVYQEIAAAYRRANTDAARRWRDVTG
jgi:hypothetical protein